MKSIFRNIFSVLIIATLMSRCSDPSITAQYEAERMLFKALKTYQKVMINPRIANQLDYQAALDAYQMILDNYSENNTGTIQAVVKQAYVAMAELWTLQGETQKAIDIYEAYLAKYPDDKGLGSFIRFANARSNEQIFNLDKAISEYDILIKNFGQAQDPAKPNLNILNLPLKIARLNRANSVSSPSNGSINYQEAFNYYNSVIEKNPKTNSAFVASYHLASLYADQRQWQDVAHTYTRMINDYPDRLEIPNLLLTLGNLYLDELNRTNDAHRIFNRLLTNYADASIAGYVKFAQARMYHQKGQVESSRKMLKKVLDEYVTDPNLCASAQLFVASTYEKAGQWDRALVEYKWVQENYPLTPQGMFVPTYIAEKYKRSGEVNLEQTAYKDAITHYQNIVKKYPKTPIAGSAQEYIIYCQATQNDLASAVAAAENLEKIMPGSKAKINSALYLGQIYEKMGEYEKAVEVYEQFSKDFPYHPVLSQVETKIRFLGSKL